MRSVAEHDMSEGTNFLGQKRRPRPLVLALIVLLHVLAFYGLVRVFAPTITAAVEETVVAAFTVTVTAPEDEPDAGAAGSAGEDAVPRPDAAPKPRVRSREDQPRPRASSTGEALASGARDSGDGTGAAGDGLGTGSGAGGGGRGGLATRPSVRSGELNQARDFPVPEGGRQARFGKSVTVVFVVTADGRARDCSVARTGVDAATTARVCPLVMEKIRFNPARDEAGNPVEARYGYRVDFGAR